MNSDHHPLDPEPAIKNGNLFLEELDMNQQKKSVDILNDKLDRYDGNFVSNLKGYFTKKFSSGNLRKQLSNDSVNSQSNYISSSPQTTDLDFKLNFDVFDRYQKIIDEHKHLLPKNFTIRQFPFSSCQDTFELSHEKKITEKAAVYSSNSVPAEISNSNDDKLPQKHSISDENLKPCSNEENLESNKTEEENNTEDMNNDLNKRFYHVFKKNELDDLVKNFSPSLKIYDSYYDHGNWCICAIKKK